GRAGFADHHGGDGDLQAGLRPAPAGRGDRDVAAPGRDHRPGHRGPVLAASREGLIMATVAATAPRRVGTITGLERDTRVKQLLYLVGGLLAFLVFTVPLVWALFRSLQPGDVIIEPPDPATFFRISTANFVVLVPE